MTATALTIETEGFPPPHRARGERRIEALLERHRRWLRDQLRTERFMHDIPRRTLRASFQKETA
jgi:hypothetical protein